MGLATLVIGGYALVTRQLNFSVLRKHLGFFALIGLLIGGSTNLTYILQGSTNLVNWTALCTAASTNAPTGSGFISETGTAYQRTILARDTVPVEQATSPRFVRFTLVWN